MKQLVLDLLAPPAPSFCNFVPGRNSEALQFVLASTTTAAAHRLLYLWGGKSSGKSHLSQSVAASEALHRVALMDAPSIETPRGPVDSPEVLIVDDVETLGDSAQIALFSHINSLSASPSKRILVAGNAAPRDLPLRPELTSRLGSGLCFQLHALSDSEKEAALQSHARSRGFALRDEVCQYLLRHGRRDMRSLIETLNALDQYSLETGREITLPLLREMAQPQLV